MGLLALGTPLAWDDAKKYADHVRTHGITQFLNIWDRVRSRCGDELLWGDEVSRILPLVPLRFNVTFSFLSEDRIHGRHLR